MPIRVELKVLDGRLAAWGFPRWGSSLAAGLDLHACVPEQFEVIAGARPIHIPTGIALKIGDPDWCGLVFPRSGLAHRDGLILGNSVGVIDPDFEGELKLSIYYRPAEVGHRVTIAPGDRIAQIVFVRIARPELVAVQEFSEASARGAARYGSTGT